MNAERCGLSARIAKTHAPHQPGGATSTGLAENPGKGVPASANAKVPAQHGSHPLSAPSRTNNAQQQPLKATEGH
ncbi:hypothetical protein SAMN05216215_100592 [Saccharopolyspora shandongensis]|uniref:Uncharacterized protein n=1 Tax=Saccharopolyspora shandongensis TaxID=418495 RepID=A0A1H2W928_9PSEU|nr:hypothetical protein [Saccharopolyspora shandongensis]SDW77057.1 hypothetical protein SAMN05216215_100592 [Saccharopolyspora shandongensis]